MDNDNSNNDLITISGESMTLDQLNTNLNTLTDNIFSMLNVETTNRTMPLFSPNTHTFENLFQTSSFYTSPITNWNNTSNLLSAMEQSFVEKNKYKNILSDEGENMIKTERFDETKHKTTCCPILQAPFKKNDEIAILPCKHIFDKESIMEWLTTENALCPVCRYKLPSKEVKIEEQVSESTQQGNSEGDTSEEELLSDVEWTNNPLYTPQDISNNDISFNDTSNNTVDDLWTQFLTSGGENATISSLLNTNRYTRRYPNLRFANTRTRPIENRIYRSVITNLIRSNEEREEQQIQQAILASLEEQEQNQNQNND